MPVAYQFANATNTIPLSQLDANFASPITLGNTSIQLGNSVSTLGNLTLGNVTITSGNIAFAIPATSGGTGLVSPGSTGNVLTSNGTAWISTGVAPGSGVTALSFGSTGLTPSTSVGGNVTVSGTLSVGSGGTGLQSLTSNSVLLGNGSSTIQFVSPGTTGNVLTSNGTTWSSSAPAGGGSAMTLISTLTASSSASLDWTGLSGYSKYLLIFQNILADTFSGTILFLQIGTGPGPTYITSNYNLKAISIGDSTTYSSNVYGGTLFSAFRLNTSYQLDTDQGISGYAIIEGMGSGNYATCHFMSFLNQVALSRVISVTGGGNQITDTNAKTAIKLSISASNILSGTASLYGISS
jgi:hypothetical protein